MNLYVLHSFEILRIFEICCFFLIMQQLGTFSKLCQMKWDVHLTSRISNVHHFPYKLTTKFLDAGIQDVSTSISIEVRKMMKSTKFEERCESDKESDKHI